MAENSKIEWTDHTFNPWIGCQEVSEACDNCYARVQNNFRKWVKGWGPHGERRRTKTWGDPKRWNREAAAAGARRKVFCASLADVFDNQVPEEWRTDLWKLIEETPHLDWLLLTKRPQNIPNMLPANWWAGYANVWLGTSLEHKKHMRRLWDLLQVKAKIHFLSCEPLLSGFDGPYFSDVWKPGDAPHLDWVICGGESAKGIHRPMDLQWARDLRDYCKASDVAFFMKQIDKVQPIPDDLMIREFPKAA